MTSLEDRKRAASARAVEFVQPGMRLGLGTGSTARHFVELLGARVRDGLSVIAVPTSEATRARAAQLGIPLSTLDETPELDLTVDGADEIAPDLTVIKGGGGALLWEKIVAAASARMIVIADDTKWVPELRPQPWPPAVPDRRSNGARRRDILSSRMAGTTCSMPRLSAFPTPKRWRRGLRQFRAWWNTGFSLAW